jgi:hypothetical protein
MQNVLSAHHKSLLAEVEECRFSLPLMKVGIWLQEVSRGQKNFSDALSGQSHDRYIIEPFLGSVLHAGKEFSGAVLIRDNH